MSFPLFATGVLDTGANLPPVMLMPAANLPPVSLIPVVHLEYLHQFFRKIKNDPNAILGEDDSWKNLKKKSRDTVPSTVKRKSASNLRVPRTTSRSRERGRSRGRSRQSRACASGRTPESDRSSWTWKNVRHCAGNRGDKQSETYEGVVEILNIVTIMIFRPLDCKFCFFLFFFLLKVLILIQVFFGISYMDFIFRDPCHRFVHLHGKNGNYYCRPDFIYLSLELPSPTIPPFPYLPYILIFLLSVWRVGALLIHVRIFYIFPCRICVPMNQYKETILYIRVQWFWLFSHFEV